MSNIVIGILAVLAGALFCFWGVAAMRGVIAVWGAFVGFVLGAGLVSNWTGENFLGTALAWIVGLLLAFVFALIAYLYYQVAVTLAMASIGFALGTALMVALGVSWNWFVILVGVVAGVLLAWACIAMDLPAILLVVLSALGGATAIVGGLMLFTGTLVTSDFERGDITARIHDSWWWWVIYAVLAVVGIVAQARLLGQSKDLREQW